MGVRTFTAIAAARILSFACRILGKQGVTMAGKLAMKIDPDILKKLSGQVRKDIIVVCGTNGKTTTNNLLCSAIEAEGQKVICNHTGSNMLMGVTAAFVLSATLSGKIDADYACIEVDEASALRVFPHMKPDWMIITNLFRDQLDRYGEIDITMDKLQTAIDMVPDMKLIINGDDPLVAYLGKKSVRKNVTFGISENVLKNQKTGEVREGAFCKCCGTRLVYRFYHYSQMGDYYCPGCGFARPAIDYDAGHVSVEDGLSFTVNGKHFHAPYRGFYNIYNILAVYAAGKSAGLSMEHFQQVLDDYHPENGRNETFQIGGTKVLLNLAKNPAGFNQNISAVMQDSSPKDLIIVINDNAQDGRDISWLWDVDFDRFADPQIHSITVGGTRAYDMRLRLKYVDIDSKVTQNLKQAVEDVVRDGVKNLYILVNYTALYSTHNMLTQMQKEDME